MGGSVITANFDLNKKQASCVPVIHNSIANTIVQELSCVCTIINSGLKKRVAGTFLNRTFIFKSILYILKN